MDRDPAALPDPELPPGDPAGSRPGAARSGWLRWVVVAGLCAVIWGGLVLVWPYWEKHQAYEIVAEHFDWDEKEKVATVKDEARKPGPGAMGELDRKTVRALRLLGTRRLAVAVCGGITSVATLGDIATLQSLNLRGCTGLPSVTGLPAGLQGLNITGCTGLTSVASLPVDVHELDLSGCKGLTSVAGLPVGLRTLNLSRCKGLTSVTELPADLRELYLHDSPGLERLGDLPPRLKEVNLRNTRKLPEEVKAQIRALVKKNGGRVLGE